MEPWGLNAEPVELKCDVNGCTGVSGLLLRSLSGVLAPSRSVAPDKSKPAPLRERLLVGGDCWGIHACICTPAHQT